MSESEYPAVPAGPRASEMEALLSRIPVILWATDASLRLLWIRGGAVRMLGLDQLFAPGKPLDTIFDPADPIMASHGAALAGRTLSFESDWMDRSYQIWVGPSYRGNEIAGTTAIALDITGTRRAERSLLWQAGFDALTGALNRSQLCQRLEMLMGEARRRSSELALLCVDIDGFAAVNDSFGTSVADEVLRGAYARIAQTASDASILGRTGADEFALVLEEPPDLAAVCDRLQNAFTQPLHSGGLPLHIGISIGSAVFPRDAASVERLLSCASAAARHAGQMGGRQCCEFSSALTAENRRRVQIDSDLREALRRDELFLVYQPQVRIEDGSIAGLEVLLRWRRGTEIVPARAFIRQAEESSVIIPIGEWVVDSALAQLKKWRDQGLDPGRLAINFGARQLADDSIVRTLKRALEQNGIPGSAVDVEITETAAMRNIAATAQLLEELRLLGLEVSIDDFGTGYSSLSYLRRFAVTGLKIDRSFVSDLPDSETSAGIVKAIIATARVFGMRLIAEGVETREQAALLRANGCDVAQGFLYSEPLEAAAMTEYLASHRRKDE